MNLRVFEAFAGYGSQAMALHRLHRNYPQFNYEVVGISEIDPYAIKAYQAVHGETAANYGDITKINWKECVDFDLFTYSFPCQDISVAGLQRGFNENSGTRSSLLWECYKVISIKRPKYLLMENVKALVQKKFMPEFMRWQDALSALGYRNYWHILNSKDYNVPQNRERVFMVSILGNNIASYSFPKTSTLTRRLIHIVERDVPESYYLTDAQIHRIVEHCERKQREGCGFKTNFQYLDGVAGTISTKYGQRETDTYLLEPQIVGYTRDKQGRVISRHLKDIANTIHTFTGGGHTTDQYIAEPKILQRPHGYFKGGITDIAPTVKASGYVDNNYLLENYRLRRLTPRECFRLMDVEDNYIDCILASGICKSRLYQLAGNSIVVECLYQIFRKMFVDTNPEMVQQLSLFDFI